MPSWQGKSNSREPVHTLLEIRAKRLSGNKLIAPAIQPVSLRDTGFY